MRRTVIPNPAFDIDTMNDSDRIDSQRRGQTGAPGFLSRAHLLDAAEKSFAESGYDGLTIRALAKACGCSVGSIYRYFGDKRALVLAMCSRLFEPAAGAAEAAGDDFAATVAQYVDLAGRHREAYQLMFWLAAQQGGDRAALPSVIKRVIDGWAGEIGADAARRCWAMVHGLIVAGQEADAIVEWSVAKRQSLADATMREGAREAVSAAEEEAEEDVTLL